MTGVTDIPAAPPGQSIVHPVILAESRTATGITSHDSHDAARRAGRLGSAAKLDFRFIDNERI